MMIPMITTRHGFSSMEAFHMLDHLHDSPTLSNPDGDHSGPCRLRRFLFLLLVNRARLVLPRRWCGAALLLLAAERLQFTAQLLFP